MFGPPLEMFHCGGTALVYNVTGHDEYIVDGVNGIVIEKDQEDEVIFWLQRLQSDSALLQKLKNGARKTAKSWPEWEDSATSFADSLSTIESDLPPHPDKFLEQYNELSLAAREHAFRSRELTRFIEREQIMSEGDEAYSNYVQLYWDEGEGIKQELVSEYNCRQWQQCLFNIPASGSPVTLRIDPTVRIGIVAIRKITVIDSETGNHVMLYDEKSYWGDIYFGGTVVCLRKAPYPVLEACGEDPQMILPKIADGGIGNNGIEVRVEICEMSFAQAFKKYSFLCEKQKTLREKFSYFFNRFILKTPTL